MRVLVILFLLTSTALAAEPTVTLTREELTLVVQEQTAYAAWRKAQAEAAQVDAKLQSVFEPEKKKP